MSDAYVPVMLQPEHVEFICGMAAAISDEISHAVKAGVTSDEKARLESIEQKAHAVYLLLSRLHGEAFVDQKQA